MAKPGPTEIADEIWDSIRGKMLEARDANRLSGVGVAKALGIQPASVSPWMRGKGKPNLVNLQKLASVLGREAVAELKSAGLMEEPWEVHARMAGHDPGDPRVQRVYATAFEAAMKNAAATIDAFVDRSEPPETGEFPSAHPKIRSG